MTGWFIVLTTVAAVFVYIFLFILLLNLLTSVANSIRKGTALAKILMLVPFLVLASFVLILDLIHTLLFIWLGYDVLSSFIGSIQRRTVRP